MATRNQKINLHDYGFTVRVVESEHPRVCTDNHYRTLEVEVVRRSSEWCAVNISLGWQSHAEKEGWSRWYGGRLSARTKESSGGQLSHLAALLGALSRRLENGVSVGPAEVLGTLEKAGLVQVGYDEVDHGYEPLSELPEPATEIWYDSDRESGCRVNVDVPPGSSELVVQAKVAGALADKPRELAAWTAAGQQVRFYRRQPPAPTPWRDWFPAVTAPVTVEEVTA